MTTQFRPPTMSIGRATGSPSVSPSAAPSMVEQDQVDGIGILGQVRAFGRRGEAVDQPGVHAGRRGHAREVLRRATVEVDPEELAVLETAGHALRQLDLAILAVGVVQARLRAARGAGRGDQRYAVSRTATMMARIAIPYCRTVIA